MGNRVTAHGAAVGSLKMSNGMTDVFLDVLTAAGTVLAQSDHQRDLVVWLAAHDQSLFGRGCVGFDLTELPIGNLGEDRDFLVSAASAATRDHIGWSTLGYEPNAERVEYCLLRFVSLLSELRAGASGAPEDPYIAPLGYPSCPRHHLLLHRFGCRTCNSGSTEVPRPIATSC
jgi:hypothetical protein